MVLVVLQWWAFGWRGLRAEIGALIGAVGSGGKRQ